MTDKLHEKAPFYDAVKHDHLVVHNWIRIVANYLVLCRSACKPLTLANQKVDADLQMLEAQKVDISVALLRLNSEPVVSPHLAEILAIHGVDRADLAAAQIMTYRVIGTVHFNASTTFIGLFWPICGRLK